MAALSDIATIAHMLKRAKELYEGCRSAPEEIFLARDHIHALTLCLEGVHSDLVTNPRSFIHATNSLAKTRTHALNTHVNLCNRALNKMEALLKTYTGFKSKHVSYWNRFRWSEKGKKVIAECKADLVVATTMLDVFLSKENLNVLWKVESMVETLTARFGALEALVLPPTARVGLGGGRRRAESNVARTIVVTLVLTRLIKVLQLYRRKQMGTATTTTSTAARKKGPAGPSRWIKPTSSGFRDNPQRDRVMQSYALSVASAASTSASSPPLPYAALDRKPRASSPDSYYISGGDSSFFPQPSLRRSSSMQRLLGRLNVRAGVPAQANERYACWRVGVGTLAFGVLKTAPEFVRHRRGQMQLRKMVAVFKEVGVGDSRALTEGDKRAKLLLGEMKKKAKAKAMGKGKKWYFAAGRVVERDPGRTGLVSVEKAIVILVCWGGLKR